MFPFIKMKLICYSCHILFSFIHAFLFLCFIFLQASEVNALKSLDTLEYEDTIICQELSQLRQEFQLLNKKYSSNLKKFPVSLSKLLELFTIIIVFNLINNKTILLITERWLNVILSISRISIALFSYSFIRNKQNFYITETHK